MKQTMVVVMAIVAMLATYAYADFKEPEELYPDKVETRFGTLKFDHGVPTEETSEKLYDALKYQRAIQAYLWGLPLVGQCQWRQSYIDQYNIKPNELVWCTKFNERAMILTANESTPYMFGYANLKDAPCIMKIPAGGVIGLVIDFWERGICDFGIFGPYAGKGGTYVFTGPTTPKEKTPYIEGARHIKSETHNIWILARINAPDEKQRDALAKKVLTGSDIDDVKSRMIDGQNKFGRNFHPRGIKYWEMLHQMINEEVVAERDRFFMYFLKDIGIEKGKPFKPSKTDKKILLEAGIVGEAMAKNFVFRERLPGVLREDGWRLILGRVEGSEPGDAMEHTQRAKYYDRFDPRSRYTYEACCTSEKICFPKEKQGMGYGGMFLDSKGRALAGDRSYVINVPPNPPVDIFWAITVYDLDTRTMVRTDQERAERGSKHEGIRSDDKGYTPIFVGPKAPKGWENNWIKSVPGRAWFPYFRFYGPTKPFFDQSWKLPQIEEVDYNTYSKK